jgi:glycerophosphoryl diester phosphodiesterase
MNINRPRVIAHRGASGHQPENSLAAFREAVRLGSDGVELDIHATSDGELVVHHDSEVPGIGRISELPIHTLKSCILATGEPIPTLQEALQALNGLEAWVEVKELPEAADARLLAIIDASPDPSRCAVHSFDHRTVARLGARRPSLRRGVLSASYPLDPAAPMVAAGAVALWQEWQLIDAELIEAIHRRGGEVIAWTVNDTAVARRLAALGVDALCGNYPERLRIP